jgi:hypothetical protein
LSPSDILAFGKIRHLRCPALILLVRLLKVFGASCFPTGSRPQSHALGAIYTRFGVDFHSSLYDRVSPKIALERLVYLVFRYAMGENRVSPVKWHSMKPVGMKHGTYALQQLFQIDNLASLSTGSCDI